MASEYTPNRRYPLYTDNDKPNLRDQYNGAIREIDSDMAEALHDSQAVSDALGSGFDAQHTVRMAIDACATDAQVEAEAQARLSADSTLQTNINNEATARQNADTSLGNRITSIEGMIPSSAFSSSSTVKAAIDSKASSTDLSTEVSARQTADTTLGNRLSTLESIIPSSAYSSSSTVKAAIDSKASTTSLNNEVSARQTADTDLGNRITANTTNINLIMGKPLFIVVGDSWAETNIYGNWTSTFANKLGVDIANYGYGGTGWNHDNGNTTNHGKFSHQLEYAATQLSANDKKRVVGILAIGGVNDFNVASFNIANAKSAIVTGASALVTARNTHFPNVPIYAAFNTQSYKYQSNPSIGSQMYRIAHDMCNGDLGNVGVIPLQNVQYSYLRETNPYDSSNLHLNSAGALLLGSALAQAISGGYSADFTAYDASSRATNVSAITFDRVSYRFNNGIYTVCPHRVTFNNAAANSNGQFVIPQTGGGWGWAIPQYASQEPFSIVGLYNDSTALKMFYSLVPNTSANAGPKLEFKAVTAANTTCYNGISASMSIIW